MKQAKTVRDFDFYIDEYMYNCQSRRLRAKTLQTYEQTLRLFERWCLDVVGITSPEEVRDATFRRYICDLQERGKYTFYCVEEAAFGYTPNKRRDYGHPISITSINNYIRNLKAFFSWYTKYTSKPNPVKDVMELKNERKAREYLEDEEVEKLMKTFDKSSCISSATTWAMRASAPTASASGMPRRSTGITTMTSSSFRGCCSTAVPPPRSVTSVSSRRESRMRSRIMLC